MMAPQPERRARTDEQLAERAFFDVVFDVAWRILGRSGLPEADRQDIAQEAAIVAFRRRATYRGDTADTAQFERWLSGIVRNVRRNFVRAKNRRPVVPLDDVPESMDNSPNAEDILSHHEYADHLLAGLPENERRAVTLYEKEALTFEEIAEHEGIGETTARARYRRGLALLRVAAARCEEEGVVIPIAVGSEPPPEVVERAWQWFRAQLEAMEGEPPPSGRRRVEPSPRDDGPPSGNARRRRVSKLLRLLPFAGLLAATTLHPDRTRDEPAEVAAALVASASPVERAPSPDAAPTVSPTAAPTVSPTAAPTSAPLLRIAIDVRSGRPCVRDTRRSPRGTWRNHCQRSTITPGGSPAHRVPRSVTASGRRRAPATAAPTRRAIRAAPAARRRIDRGTRATRRKMASSGQ